MMRKVVRKWFWIWQFEEEEKWLNEMARQGWQLLSAGYCRYEFEEGTSGEYIVRLELLENMPLHKESQKYIEFMETTGAEYVGSVNRWVYFRKKSTGEGFNLYSDIESRANHVKRMLPLIGVLGISEWLLGIQNIHLFFTRGNTFNFGVSILLLLLACLFTYGFIRVEIKRRRLEKEKILRE